MGPPSTNGLHKHLLYQEEGVTPIMALMTLTTLIMTVMTHGEAAPLTEIMVGQVTIITMVEIAEAEEMREQMVAMVTVGVMDQAVMEVITQIMATVHDSPGSYLDVTTELRLCM